MLLDISGVNAMITALAGGVGASKLLVGVTRIVDPTELTVIVNTGDDIQLHGLHISPDLDIVTYSLAEIVDETKGWGIEGDTFNALNALKRFTTGEWFNLGDKDLATHIFRTEQLKKGKTLTEITREICIALKLRAAILPMTDGKFETRIVTPAGTIHFEEYMVKNRAKDEVLGVEFFGAETAKPSAGVLEAIENTQLVVLCPSNPIVSIGTILSVKGIRDSLKKSSAKKVGVSPIIGGMPIKGPADKLLRGLGHEASAFGTAELYADFLDEFVIDVQDASEKQRIERLGIKVKVANTVMKTLEDKVQLARIVLGQE